MGRAVRWSALVAFLIAASVHHAAAFKAEDFKVRPFASNRCFSQPPCLTPIPTVSELR